MEIRMAELFWGISFFVDYFCTILVYLVVLGARLKCTLVKTFLISILVVFGETVIVYPIGENAREILVFLLCLPCVCLFMGNKFKWLALYLPSLVVLSLMQTISMTILNAIVGWSNIDLIQTLAGYPIFIVLCITNIVIDYYDLKRDYDYSIFQLIFLNVSAICLLFMIGEVQAFLSENQSLLRRTETSATVHNIMLVVCIILCVLVFYLGVIKSKLDDTKRLAAEKDFLLNIQKDQMEMVIKSEAKLHAFKHDLIAHLNALNGFASEGDIVKVKDYCDALLSDTSSFRIVSYTGNPALDGVLGQLKGLADEKGVELDIKMTVPKEKKISDYDLCILVSNIIKNAIEANNSGGKVDIKAWPFSENLCIISSNTTEHPLEYKKGVLLSTKRDYKSPGYGMRNIQAVIDKYDGDFQIKSDGDLVKVEALV